MQGLRSESAEAEALEAARYAVYRASYEVKLLLAEIAHKRFNPNQPRVPAGNSDGGQWTATGGSGGARIHRVSRTPSRPTGGGRSGPPQTVPVRIAGRTEMVSPTTYNQLQSSAALARNMTNLARRFD